MKSATINKTLFVGKLNPIVTSGEIAKLFGLYGTVDSVTIGNEKCDEGFNYCFVRMSSVGEASQCVEVLNNTLFKGEQISIRF